MAQGHHCWLFRVTGATPAALEPGEGPAAWRAGCGPAGVSREKAEMCYLRSSFFWSGCALCLGTKIQPTFTGVSQPPVGLRWTLRLREVEE